MTDKMLTDRQIINLLKKLKNGLPENRWLFVGDGRVHLMATNEYGEQVETRDGTVDQDYIVDDVLFGNKAGGGGF